MRVHLNRYSAHNSAQPQFIIGPEPHTGEQHVGEYPDVVSAWHAAQSSGAEAVYLHAPNGSPLRMADPSDTKGLSWFNE
jgi:hypothetical protein